MDIGPAIAALAEAGFDIVHPFDTARSAREPGLELLADTQRPLGLLIGNTRALWPRFLEARRADPELDTSTDPLERYTEAVATRAAEQLSGLAWFAHRRYGDQFLPFQRLAVTTGLGTLAPTQLVIHPIYGPWFALRAVIVIAGEPVQAVLPSAPCVCESSCHAALATAVAATGPDRWRAWLAVRDACPVGREHRYTEDQITYHYSFLRDRESQSSGTVFTKVN